MKEKTLTNNDPILKRWLSSSKLTDKFLPYPTKENISELAVRLKVPYDRIRQLMQPDNVISAHIADTYAVRLGCHPANIWSDWCDLEPEEGSNPKAQKKKNAKEQARIFCTDKNQP